MRVTRRRFLGAAGCCGLALGLGRPASGSLADPERDPGLARHVLNRCTFGHRPGDLEAIQAMGVTAYLDRQLAYESIDENPACLRRVRRLETLNCPAGELFEYQESLLFEELASGKLFRAVYSERQLFEVMVDFWTDHFNIDISKGDCPWLKTADDREVIRKHALGRFPALLRASALGPAMLWYLDGRENRRRTAEEEPNENYARELLELHTLGVRGGYTQEDVMEAARCLTGWSVRSTTWFGKGRVEFVPEHHDSGPKRVLGETIPAGLGAEDVDRLLAILIRHGGTAKYLAEKLCRRFIGEQYPPEACVSVARTFEKSGGDIRQTLATLFATEAFRNPGPLRFSRPFHFLAAALRVTGAEIHDARKLLDYLARMGQSPFQYPTPDGYPLDPEPWYGSMLWRWHFVYALSRDEVPGVTADWARQMADAGGGEALVARLLGRRPDPDELNLAQDGQVPGLVLACPAFQGV